MKEGIVVINKPKGITSHDVVARVRRKFNMRQVGHAGTLDPLATGVLIILLGKSTLAKDVRSKIKTGGNVSAAEVLGEAFASQAIKQGITKVCFDRGGYLYHGRIKVFAEAARKAGLEF